MRKRGRTKAGAAGAARGSAPVVILLLVLFLASVARADDTAKVVSNTQLDPYGYTGLIEQGDIQGSGVVVGSPHLVVTAAHVIFDPVRRFWREFSWKPRNEGSGRTVRILRYIGSYADLVETHGETDARTFAQDFALGMSYEPLLDDRRYAPVDGSRGATCA